MQLNLRPYQGEDDFWRIRRFLRAVFLLNDRLERSWHVARWDYWRWHFIENLRIYGSVGEGLALWETELGEIAAVLNGFGGGELRLHVHPHYRTPDLLDEMLAQAEAQLAASDDQDCSILYLPVDSDDSLLQGCLLRRGYTRLEGRSHKWQRDLDGPLPVAVVPPGYTIRSMGGPDEHPARSWASWRSFHSDEPDENYDGDYSWFASIQSAPLYRRDLDIIAAAPGGKIAAFCTIFYDDDTRSAVCVLVGTAFEHWRRGLGKAVLLEGLRRLQRQGCTRVFATGFDPPASALYGSVMQTAQIAETWRKKW